MDIKSICNKIIKGKCVLIIGPEFPFQGKRLDTYKEKFTLNQQNYLRFYGEEDFFKFDNNNQRDRQNVVDQIEEIFENVGDLNIYQIMAKLPFPLFISLSPDDLLAKSFYKEKFKYFFSYYVKLGSANNRPSKFQGISKMATEISSKEPVLYNLFGHFEEPQSLILEYDDLFDFFTSILKYDNLPNPIRDILQSDTSFIFLGFDYRKWYMKLLMRVLKIDSKKWVLAEQPTNGAEQIFFQHHFTIDYINSKPDDFILQIYEYLKSKNELRSDVENSKPNFHFLLDELSQGNIEEPLKMIKDYYQEIKDDENLRLIINLMGNHSNIQRSYHANTEDKEKLRTEINRIRESLIMVITEEIKSIPPLIQ